MIATRKKRISKLINGIALVTFIIAASACVKEQVTCEQVVGLSKDTCACDEMPPAPIWGWEYIYDSPETITVQFSPSDPEVLMYVKAVEGDTHEIWTKNISTDETNLVYTGLLGNKPMLGHSGTILLLLPDNDLYRLSPGSPTLTQITNSANFRRFIWDEVNDIIVANREDNNFTEVLNAEGESLYTLEDIYLSPTTIFYDESTLLGLRFEQLVLKELAADANIEIHSLEENSSTFDLCIDNEGAPGGNFVVGDKVYYSYLEGVFTYDFETGQTELIHESCESLKFSSGTVNANGTKMIWLKGSASPVSEEALLVTNEWVLQDMQGNHLETLSFED